MTSPDIAAHIRKDSFANWLGATIEIIEPGYSRVSLVVTASILNFHGMTHGGLVFSLGDIAFAAASNSHGQTALFGAASGILEHSETGVDARA